MNYLLIFLTGLTTGGISCVALQGGLLAAVLATQPKAQARISTAAFLVSKIFAYTLVGGLLGYFGSVVQLTANMRIWFQIIAALFMFGMAANMLELHPIFRYFVIQPPKWIGKLLRRQSKDDSIFAPILLGLFTILIPCGVTQAMEISAIASGNFLTGSLTMLAFTLGTAPMFILVGYLTVKLSATFQRYFTRLAAVLIIVIGLISANGALVLSDSKYSFDKWLWAFEQIFVASPQPTNQNIFMIANGRGYTPNKFTVKVGIPVNLKIKTENNYSCSSMFTIPSMGITKRLPATGETEIVFTPTKAGPLSFTCGMGMYSGIIDVKI